MEDASFLSNYDGESYMPNLNDWILLLSCKSFYLESSKLLKQVFPGLVRQDLIIFIFSEVLPHSVIVMKIFLLG